MQNLRPRNLQKCAMNLPVIPLLDKQQNHMHRPTHQICMCAIPELLSMGNSCMCVHPGIITRPNVVAISNGNLLNDVLKRIRIRILSVSQEPPIISCTNREPKIHAVFLCQVYFILGSRESSPSPLSIHKSSCASFSIKSFGISSIGHGVL